jgi:integrase
MILHQTKNKERRALPIVGYAQELLERLATGRRTDTPFLFPRQDGRKPLDIRQAWETALVKAAIDDFRFHDWVCFFRNDAELEKNQRITTHRT